MRKKFSKAEIKRQEIFGQINEIDLNSYDFFYLDLSEYEGMHIRQLCYNILIYIQNTFHVDLPNVDQNPSVFLPYLIDYQAHYYAQNITNNDTINNFYLPYWENYSIHQNVKMIEIFYDLYFPIVLQNPTLSKAGKDIVKNDYFPFLCNLLFVLKEIIPINKDYSIVDTTNTDKKNHESSRIWNILGNIFNNPAIGINQSKINTQEKFNIYQKKYTSFYNKLFNLSIFLNEVLQSLIEENQNPNKSLFFSIMQQNPTFTKFYNDFIAVNGNHNNNIEQLIILINNLINGLNFHDKAISLYDYLRSFGATLYEYPDGTKYMSSFSYKNHSIANKKTSKSIEITFLGFLFSLFHIIHVEGELGTIINSEKKQLKNEIKRYKNEVIRFTANGKKVYLTEQNIQNLILQINLKNKYASKKREYLKKISNTIETRRLEKEQDKEARRLQKEEDKKAIRLKKAEDKEARRLEKEQYKETRRLEKEQQAIVYINNLTSTTKKAAEAAKAKKKAARAKKKAAKAAKKKSY